jgi:hypothetical protein
MLLGIKSTIRWVGHAERMTRETHTSKIVVINGGRNYSEDQNIDGRILLENIFGIYGLDSSASGQEPETDAC